jgi:uncharacterized protein YdaU (DUF1376 family)
MLTNAERGLYITACALIYSAGGPIERQHLRSACSDHGNAFNRQLKRLVNLGKLIENGSEIDNKRCENELENARKRGEKARENGAKGGRPNGLENPKVSAAEKLTINHQPSTTRTPTGVLTSKPNGLDLSGKAQVPSRDVPATMTEIWNEECGAITKARAPNETRKRNCIRRWRDDFGSDPEQWRAYCRKVAASTFLAGNSNSDRAWNADLDWVLKPDNLSHIMEGRYDNRLANGRGEGEAGSVGSVKGPSGPAPRFEELFNDDGSRKAGLPH